MKKIVLSLVLVFAVYANSSALELNDYKVLSKINNESTMRSLVRYLDVDYIQEAYLKDLFEMTGEKVKVALSKGDEVAAEKALYFNLANMKNLFSEEQYKKYLVVLNLTVAGREEILVAEL